MLIILKSNTIIFPFFLRKNQSNLVKANCFISADLLLQDTEPWLPKPISKLLRRVIPARRHHAVNHIGQSLFPGIDLALQLLPRDIWED